MELLIIGLLISFIIFQQVEHNKFIKQAKFRIAELEQEVDNDNEVSGYDCPEVMQAIIENLATKLDKQAMLYKNQMEQVLCSVPVPPAHRVIKEGHEPPKPPEAKDRTGMCYHKRIISTNIKYTQQTT